MYIDSINHCERIHHEYYLLFRSTTQMAQNFALSPFGWECVLRTYIAQERYKDVKGVWLLSLSKVRRVRSRKVLPLCAFDSSYACLWRHRLCSRMSRSGLTRYMRSCDSFDPSLVGNRWPWVNSAIISFHDLFFIHGLSCLACAFLEAQVMVSSTIRKRPLLLLGRLGLPICRVFNHV